MILRAVGYDANDEFTGYRLGNSAPLPPPSSWACWTIVHPEATLGRARYP